MKIKTDSKESTALPEMGMTESGDLLATILVHHKENRKKCSLEGLRGQPYLRFLDPVKDAAVDVTGHTVLEVDAPVLTRADAGRPLLVLDATWRLLPGLRSLLCGDFISRSLPPGLETAYPRRSTLFPDPPAGLASVEALYAALCILGHRDDDLLSGYRGREAFLRNCRKAGIPGHGS